MYQNHWPSDLSGEKSFPISDGRYRVFYKVLIKTNGNYELILFDIDDNKQFNLDRFSTHKIISFDHD